MEIISCTFGKEQVQVLLEARWSYVCSSGMCCGWTVHINYINYAVWCHLYKLHAVSHSAGGVGAETQKEPSTGWHAHRWPARGSCNRGRRGQSLILSSYQAGCRNKCKFYRALPFASQGKWHVFFMILKEQETRAWNLKLAVFLVHFYMWVLGIELLNRCWLCKYGLLCLTVTGWVTLRFRVRSFSYRMYSHLKIILIIGKLKACDSIWKMTTYWSFAPVALIESYPCPFLGDYRWGKLAPS